MKVSIILVVYKTLEWIEECLNSVFGQSFGDFEIIIINNDDDDAMDGTIRRLIADKKNVRYVRNESNIGGAEACNQGIRLARGEYVFIMDSDDLLPKDALYHLVSSADATDSDIIIGRGKIIRGSRTHNVDYRPDWISWERPLTVSSISQAPFLTFNPYYWGRLYRRSMLVDNGIYLLKDAINADRNFNCRALLAASSISVCPQNTYLWRKRVANGDNCSITQARTKRNNFLDRVSMMVRTDAEFKKFGDEKLYQYSRISGLMRLLILAVDTAGNPEFRKLFLDIMHEYLKGFYYDEISECEFFSYRIKTIAYLIKSGKYDDFDVFIQEETDITSRIEKNKKIYSYSDIDVPIRFRTQYIFHIPVVTIEGVDRNRSGIEIDGSARLPSDCRPDLAGICLMDGNRQEACRIDIENCAIEGERLRFSTLITNSTLEKLDKSDRYYLTLYYVVHLRAGRTKLTDAAGNTFYLTI